MSEFLRKLTWWLERGRRETELNEELHFHLEEEAAERQAGGLAEPAARLAARRELGNLGLVREDVRSAWGWPVLEQFLQDLRYAARVLWANKLFTGLAVLSLALGIGANTAIFSFMDAILLRALPVPHPESLAVLNWRSKQFSWGSFVMHGMRGDWYDDAGQTTSPIFPFPAFELFQKNSSPFDAVFAYRDTGYLNFAVSKQAFLARSEYVSGDYFRGLEVALGAGRLIGPDDDRIGAPPVAVVSFAFSQKSLGGPANALGQRVLINNQPFLVTGVTPPGFFGVDPAAAPDVFLPLHADLVVESGSQFGTKPEQYLDPNYYWIEVMARLRPGVTLEQAQAVLAPAFGSWVAGTASTAGERANLPKLLVKQGATGLETLRQRYSRPLYVLLTLVGLILAVACANVANLLLARAATRRREIALRLSVGASRFRLIRQLLTESLLLSSLGGVLSILVAWWGTHFLSRLLANGDPALNLQAGLNWRVLGVAGSLAWLTGLLFGLAPALQSTRVDVIDAMKDVRASQSLARRSFRRISLSHLLMAGQIAVSCWMLIAAGLFVRTLSNLESMELGFNRENILMFNLNARDAGRQRSEIAGFYAGLLREFKRVAGVRQASLSNQSLVNAGFSLNFTIPGEQPSPQDRMLQIGPSFFTTMQIPILAGRETDDRDQPGSAAVAVISEQFAKVNFGSENPIGRHVILSANRELPNSRDMEIVGIARDAHYGPLRRETPPVLYIPYNQGLPQPEEMVFELRTAGDPLAYVQAVREIVRRADSRVPISRVRTQTGEINQTLNQEIVFARLCTAFAVLALVIAGVGLYGIVSYNVARRTNEIGIRMALGAQQGRVVWIVLAQVFGLAAGGLAIGLPAAFASSKLIQAFLFGAKPNDPLAIGSATGILLLAAILAGYVPARRASRIDPMAALRHE